MGRPVLSQGFVDSASTYEIVTACDLGNPKTIYPWAWTVSQALTTCLILNDHIRFAPGPGPSGTASDLYAVLTDALIDTNVLSEEPAPDPRTRSRALRTVRKELGLPGALDLLRQRVAGYEADEINYRPWLDWIVRSRSWLENSRRLGTLINREFSAEIAAVLNVSVVEVDRLVSLSGDVKELESVMRKPSSDTFGLLSEAFLTSALIRGRYHELVIGRHAQLIRHPMRAQFTNATDSFDASKLQAYFASAVLFGALTERSPAKRIRSWVDSVMRARRQRREFERSTGQAFLSDRLPGRAPVTDPDALERAVDLALELGVASSVRRFYQVMDFAFQVGVAGAGFVLSPLAAGAVGVGWWALSPVAKLGKIRRRHAVTELARFGPGIVDQAQVERLSTRSPKTVRETSQGR